MAKNLSVDEIVQILRHKNKPFTFYQIRKIYDEAVKISYEYGFMKKRIGNGSWKYKVKK